VISAGSARSAGSVAALLALALGACGEPAGGGGRDAISVRAVVDGPTATPVARVVVRAHGTGGTHAAELAAAGPAWVGEVRGLVTGADGSLSADALDAAGAVVATVSIAPVAWTAGDEDDLSLVLRPGDGPSAGPAVDALLARLGRGPEGAAASADLSVFTDPREPPAAVAWESTDGVLSAASSAAAWTRFRAGARASVHVVGVRGQVASSSYMLAVASKTGSAVVTADFNNWPVVRRMTASSGRLDVGERATLEALASDADLDPLAFEWSTTCAGSFSNVRAARPTFTLAARSATGSCALVATVTDGRGGRGTGQLSIQTTAAPAANLAPVIESTFRSALGVPSGGTLVFRVAARDPEQTAVITKWKASVGTLTVPADVGGASEVRWTAPTAWKPAPAPSVTATVTDRAGVSTTEVFMVTPL
jgi:hypothetical protein